MNEQNDIVEDFKSEGYAVVENSISLQYIEEAYLEGMNLFSDVTKNIEVSGLHFGIGVKNGFKEIVQRHANRFEMKYSSDDNKFENLLEKNDHLQNLVGRALQSPTFDIINKSLVISLPGCEDQAWHSDGPHLDMERHLPCHCLNLFIPLIDLKEIHGPTEIRPRSHVYSSAFL